MGLSAADLIEEFAETDATYEIFLKGGKKLTVKNISDMAQIAALQKRAQQIKRASDNKTVPVQWKPYLPISEDVAGIVAELEQLLIDPAFDTIEALDFCKKAGPTAAYIHLQIMTHIGKCVPEQEAETIDELKNASVPMSSGDVS